MSKIILAIDKNYCASWDVFCGIRELLQNAKDGDDAGHAMTVVHSPRAARLTIANANVYVDPSRLLILGKSDKTPGQQRGQFGEGFVLGTLALVRRGHDVKFTNGSLTWKVSFEHAEAGHPFEGSELLTYKSRKIAAPYSDFKVEIENISTEAWNILRKMFLFIDVPNAGDKLALPTGTLLLAPAHKGHVFARGIFVRVFEDMNYLELDRDRNALNEWNLQYKLGELWQDACRQHPEIAVPRIYEMAKNDTAEMRNLKHHADTRLLQHLRDRFNAEHGADAAPVTDMTAARQVSQVGATPVVVSNTLEELLVKSGLSVATVAARLEGVVETRYAPNALTDLEDEVLSHLAPFIPVLAVVSFRGNQEICRLINDNTTVGVERRLLGGSFKTLLASALAVEAKRRDVLPFDLLLSHVADPVDQAFAVSGHKPLTYNDESIEKQSLFNTLPVYVHEDATSDDMPF
jgi:hypothetical protein